jgi:hypothetical protein
MRMHDLGELDSHDDERRRKNRTVVKMNGMNGKNWRN